VHNVTFRLTGPLYPLKLLMVFVIVGVLVESLISVFVTMEDSMERLMSV
jgi:hypothetical protein